MRYSLIFLLNEDLTKVLLVHKTHGPYINAWNGLGGKVESKETPLAGALREIQEEIDISMEGRLIPIQTMQFYDNADKCSFDKVLDVYCGKINEDEVILDKIDSGENLDWGNIELILNSFVRDITLAGDGNIPYLVNLALNILK